jgi:hypothetical protein
MSPPCEQMVTLYHAGFAVLKSATPQDDELRGTIWCNAYHAHQSFGAEIILRHWKLESRFPRLSAVLFLNSSVDISTAEGSNYRICLRAL